MADTVPPLKRFHADTIFEVRRYRDSLNGDQIRFLAVWAHDLTVHARDTCVAGTDDVADPKRLRVFNEAQHQVTSHLRDLIAARSERYPDGVFARTLWAFAEELHIWKSLVALVERMGKRHEIAIRS